LGDFAKKRAIQKIAAKAGGKDQDWLLRLNIDAQ
jgi:hypothetical protein